MLPLTIKRPECWDPGKEEFIPEGKPVKIMLEHSLVSVSKWEAHYHKSFFDTTSPRTYEEDLFYIKCMTITQNVDDDIYKYITSKQRQDIRDYIDDPMTATTFREKENNSTNHERITSELIYYWMLSYGIPAEFQKWHLNRLITLIRIFAIKNSPDSNKKRKPNISERNALNAARRAKYHTKG